MLRSYTSLWAGTALVLALVGCGSSAVPVEKLASSKSAIRAAEEVGARGNPRGALHLRLAEDQLSKAQRLIDEGENEEALLYLNQAQADAELALGLAKHQDEQRAAQQAQARIQDLRQQSR